MAMEPVIIPRDAGSSDCSWCDDRRTAVQGAGAHPNAGNATTAVTATEATTHVAAAEAATHVTAAAMTAATSAVSESNRGQQRDCQGD
jgi:hypothetical protein